MQISRYPDELYWSNNQTAWDLDVRNQYFAYGACRVLKFLDQGRGVDAVEQVWREMGGPEVTLTFGKQEGLVPGYTWCVTNDGRFIGFMVGTSTLEQALFQHQSWKEAVVLNYFESGDLYFIKPNDYRVHNIEAVSKIYLAKGGVVADYIEQLKPRPSPIILCGHSYGGAIAIAAAVLLAKRGITDIQVLTFGSPCVGTEQFYWHLAGMPVIRYMCHDDPVPDLPGFFPLYFRDSQVSAGKKRDNIITYAQPRQGYILSPFGTLRRKDFPTVPFTGFFMGADRSPEDPDIPLGLDSMIVAHYLTTYEKRLAMAIPQSLRTTTAPTPPPAPVQSSLAVPLGPVKQIVRVQNPPAKITIVIDRSFGNPLFDGGAMPFVPAQYSATIQKVGVKWTVVWLSFVIAEGTQSQCRTLRKSFNHFLRRLQTMSSFSLTEFSPTFASYITHASAGGSGFKPDALPVT